MLLFLSLIVGITFLTISHPLAIGLVLLCQTLLISLLTGLLAPTFWFSYILFLVFLGGILVLFIYVTSLASNEIFSISTRTLVFIGSFVGLILILTRVNDPLLWNPLTTIDQSFNAINLFTPNSTTLLVKLYNNPTHFLTLLLVIYLFLTLIAVVTITQIHEGPLRAKN